MYNSRGNVLQRLDSRNSPIASIVKVLSSQDGRSRPAAALSHHCLNRRRCLLASDFHCCFRRKPRQHNRMFRRHWDTGEVPDFSFARQTPWGVDNYYRRGTRLSVESVFSLILSARVHLMRRRSGHVAKPRFAFFPSELIYIGVRAPLDRAIFIVPP